ncbi:MAG: FAD-dependent oxidoreductase [Mycoplasmataceae bacterium]|jgi:thioredoxin reductase (NADPH)|nr:FAD-dependent oxidoreductase [Mycoplasmataceae bacterium]
MALEILTASDTNTYDILIIGAGPSGLTAAIYGRRANLKVGFIENEVPGGKIVNIPVITNYPGIKSISGADLALNMYTQATEAGAIYLYGKVTGITQKSNYHVVFLENGVNYFAKTLIIATGTTEIKLNVPGENEYKNKGVSYCAICDGSLVKEKDVVVFGGNDIAIKDAIYLAGIANKVSVICKENALSGEPTSIETLNKSKNVNVIFNSLCKNINGDGQSVKNVVIQNTKSNVTEEIKTSYVFVFIGSHTDAEFLSNMNDVVDKNGIIQTDQYKQTKIKGLFAIGDITRNIYRQIATAVSDGAIAALSAVKYIKEQYK